MAAELEARLRSMALNDVEAAISGGDVEAVRRWLETGGDVNAKGDSAGNWSLLYEACCNSVGESLVGITGREYWETRQKNNEARVAIITSSAKTRRTTLGGRWTCSKPGTSSRTTKITMPGTNSSG